MLTQAEKLKKRIVLWRYFIQVEDRKPNPAIDWVVQPRIVWSVVLVEFGLLSGGLFLTLCVSKEFVGGLLCIAALITIILFWRLGKHYGY